MRSKRNIGQQYENLAADYLGKHGCRIIARNFRCQRGEIDLVVQEDRTVAFVEVKYRTNDNFGSAISMVTAAKQRKLIYTAQIFLQQNNKLSSLDARFDVVGITPTANGNELEYEWIRGAFTT